MTSCPAVLRRALLIVALAGGLAVPLAHAQTVLALSIERAADGAVQGLVIPGERIAGAVLWPGPEVIEGETLPPGTLALAAHALQESVVAGAAGVRPVLEFGPGFIALGIEVPAADEDRLFGLLARLATPAAPPQQVLAEATRKWKQRRDERWADPLERARLAALGLVFPGAIGGWNAAGTPNAVERVTTAAVHEALAEIRRGSVEVRVAGSAGLAARAALALGTRIGTLDIEPPAESDALPGAAIIPAPEGGASGDAALVLGFRIPPELAAATGGGIAVLLEALSEGQASLPQRLRVAANEGVHSLIEVVPSAGGGGVLLLGARTRRESAVQVWRVLEGVVSSVRSLPLSESAVYRARQRLDEQAGYRAADALAALTGFLRRQPWSWPPEGERELTPADVRQASRLALDPGRRVTVVAGALPDDLSASESLRGAARVDWSRFDPFAAGLAVTPEETVVEPSAVAALAVAEALLRSLAPGGDALLEGGFEAVYRAREATPLGDAETEIRIDAGPGTTAVDVAGRQWTVRSRAGDEGAETQLPGAPAASVLPEPERLAVQLYRQPVLLAAAASGGTLPVALTTTTADGRPVEALRTELPEGTVLLLTFAPGTRDPALLRVYYLGRGQKRPPDEEVRFTGWTTIGGVRLASRFTISDPVTGVRDVRLVEWTFKAP